VPVLARPDSRGTVFKPYQRIRSVTDCTDGGVILKMMGRRRKSPVESPDAICRNRWLDVWDISAWIGEF